MEIFIKKEDEMFVQGYLETEFAQIKKNIDSLSERDMTGAVFYRKIVNQLYELLVNSFNFYTENSRIDSSIVLAGFERMLQDLYWESRRNFMELVIIDENISSFNEELEGLFAHVELYNLAYYFLEAERINLRLYNAAVDYFFGKFELDEGLV